MRILCYDLLIFCFISISVTSMVKLAESIYCSVDTLNHSYGWLSSYYWRWIWHTNHWSLRSEDKAADLGYRWPRAFSCCYSILLSRCCWCSNGIWYHKKIHLQSSIKLADGRTKSYQSKYCKPHSGYLLIVSDGWQISWMLLFSCFLNRPLATFIHFDS